MNGYIQDLADKQLKIEELKQEVKDWKNRAIAAEKLAEQRGRDFVGEMGVTTLGRGEGI